MRDPSRPRDSTCLLSLVTHTVLYFAGFASLALLVCNSIRLPCLLLLILWLVLILYILGVLEARLAGVGLWGPGEKAFLQVRPAPATI